MQLLYTASKQLHFIHSTKLILSNYIILFEPLLDAVNIRLTYTNRFSFSFKYKHSDRRCSKDGLEHSWQVSYVSKTRSFRCVCLETDRCPPLYDYRPYEKFWFLNDANVSAACVSRGEVRATLNVRSVKYKRTVARNLLPA